MEESNAIIIIVVDGFVALGTLALAAATFSLVRQTKQEAEATKEAVQASKDAVEATRVAGLENVRARIDARAPRIVVSLSEPRWPPSFKDSSGVEGRHVQIEPDQQFPSSQDVGRPLLLLTRGRVRNDGTSTAIVTFDHGTEVEEDPGWIGIRPAPRGFPPQYLIAPGGDVRFYFLDGRPVHEWMETYNTFKEKGGPNPEKSTLWLRIGVTDQLDAGIIDRMMVEVQGYPIEPVPQNREHWQLASENRPVASVTPAERIYYASKMNNRLLAYSSGPRLKYSRSNSASAPGR